MSQNQTPGDDLSREPQVEHKDGYNVYTSPVVSDNFWDAIRQLGDDVVTLVRNLYAEAEWVDNDPNSIPNQVREKPGMAINFNMRRAYSMRAVASYKGAGPAVVWTGIWVPRSPEAQVGEYFALLQAKLLMQFADVHEFPARMMTADFIDDNGCRPMAIRVDVVFTENQGGEAAEKQFGEVMWKQIAATDRILAGPMMTMNLLHKAVDAFGDVLTEMNSYREDASLTQPQELWARVDAAIPPLTEAMGQVLHAITMMNKATLYTDRGPFDTKPPELLPSEPAPEKEPPSPAFLGRKKSGVN